MAQATSRLRLTCRHGLDPRPFHVRFVVDKVTLGQVFLRVLLFSPRQCNSTVAPYASSCTFCSYEKDKRAELSKSKAVLVIGEHRIKKILFTHQRDCTRPLALNVPIDTDVFSFFISLRIPCGLTGYVSDLWTINYRLYARHRNRRMQNCRGPGHHGD